MTAENTFPWSKDLEGLSYPFPGAVKNTDNAYVHYGDWGVQYPQPAYVVYFEQYSDGSEGVFYLNEKGGTVDSLKDSATITGAGYGLLQIAGARFSYSVTFKDRNRQHD